MRQDRRPAACSTACLAVATLTIIMAVVIGMLQFSTASASGVIQRTPGATQPRSGYPVRVYFSRHPVSDDHYGAVYPVRRVAPTLGVATFALRHLLAGPTGAEAAVGYFTEWPQTLQGPATCGPLGFTLRLNHRGQAVEPGTATLRLCRRTRLAGVGASARMMAETRATLLQFPAVRRVVILTVTGACFGDLSGLDRCLRPATSARA